MAIELRKTGINVIGDVPWGTHLCHFYETKQDLLDTLVPYFKAGLESKEFCVWVVSDSELMTVEAAKEALAQAVPDLDRHLAAGNIEVLNGLDWYLEKNVFNLERVASAWEAKLKRALALGYEGMRVSGDTFWLREKDWKDFCAYEKQLNDSITYRHMNVLCTYPLAKSGAAEILDVARTHQFAIARRQGEWEIIETPELIQTKDQIRRLNEELEQRVIERTNDLRVANQELRNEITERKRAEALLDAKEQEFRAIVENAPDHIARYNREFRRTYANPALAKSYDLPAEALIGRPMFSIIRDAGLDVKENELAQIRQRFAAVFETGKSYEFEISLPMPPGRRDYSVRLFPELDLNGSVINVLSIARDITESKRAEEQLKATSDQLRALSVRLGSAREEESIRIAREIHDELGSMLTTLKWDLEEIQKTLSTPVDQPQLAAVREKLSALTTLTDMSVSTLRRIASELRPSVLDDLGLVAAIEWQALQFQARTGIICDCDCSMENVELSAEQSTAVFRIFQEALTNVLRHAQATRVDIKINKEKSHFVLSVSDNGRGITDGEKSEQHSLGLLGMRERAYLIGGEVRITSAEGPGTVVTVRVPIAGSETVRKMTR